ncbi:hypothetical protein [Marinomonas sp. PE14-40]|uniref:hypothetical protein n=1 Tax=Marinomonas sp. PE14-40 TaxID=3060621 RepID=UPI003F679F9B
MSNQSAHHNEAEGVSKPVGVLISIGFCIVFIAFFAVIIIATQFGLFPAYATEGYYFQQTGLFVNLLSNMMICMGLACSLSYLKQDAIYWALGLFLFDFFSTSYWVLTHNWFDIVGLKELFAISIFWSGICVIFVYCLKLKKKKLLS